jgi:hypothetical protein
MATGTRYVTKIHADTNDNIVFDGLSIEYFNDSSNPAVTISDTTIKVGDYNGTHHDSFEVSVDYPASYAGTAPGTLRVNDHIIAAFNDIQAVVNAVPFVGFPGGGPAPVILSLGAITGGSGYPNGVHGNIPLTGGTGKGAKADITVAGGIVTVVSLVEAGLGYTVADVLSANLGVAGNVYPSYPGTGFSVPVATIGSPLTNTSYV